MSDIEFLRAKIEFFAEATGHSQSASNIRQLFLGPLGSLAQAQSVSRAELLELDRSVQKFMGILPREERAAIKQKLVAQFGFSQIGEDNLSIIKRILKRERIANDREAEVVRDFLASQTNEDELGEAKFAMLAEILDRAGY